MVEMDAEQAIHLVYVITQQTSPTLVYLVKPYLVPVLKQGDYGKPYLVTDIQQIPTLYLETADKKLWEHLNKQSVLKTATTMGFVIECIAGSKLMALLLQTGRCYFSSHRSSPLKPGPLRQGKLEWLSEEDNKQRLHCLVPGGGACSVIPLQPLWYVDHEQHLCGHIQTSLAADIVSLLLLSPPMTSDQLQRLSNILTRCSTEEDAYRQLRQELTHQVQICNEEQIDNWYCDVQPAKQHSWFECELGITLQGKRINLLPYLVDLIQMQLAHHSFKELLSLPDDRQFLIEFPNGDKFSITMRRLRRILLVLTELYTEESLNEKKHLVLSQWSAAQLPSFHEILESPSYHWNNQLELQKFSSQIKKLSNDLPEVKLPKTFLGELRPYQWHGLNWLQFLRECGWGGVLADDMGLGKTIQVLAHLYIEKQAGRMKKPSLIIVPTSLLMNWSNEAARFAPNLKLLILHGSERKSLFSKTKKIDVILTTYPLIIRDQEFFLQQDYHIVILDEAQCIKNFRTKANQVVRKLSSAQRLCLTGTPMENHLGELWSIFHFTLPGLLGDSRQFQRLFRVPIEKQRDNAKLEVLRNRIAPFFLRRTKGQVAKELPSKLEIVQPITLTDAQRELYESVRLAMQEKVFTAIKANGLAKSQIIILDALLKLRQICCDPRLLKFSHLSENYLASAKFELLMEMLPNLLAQGRHILLFSQFTEMLQLIEAACKAQNIDYVTLTGKTLDREKPIQLFQSGKVSLFLISLKAGGVGLNLTAADVVIHYDPWWNPAAENQATDRAHRIGQDKNVFVYKLITSNTIEEKILALQKNKQSLLDNILKPSENWSHAFSEDELLELFAPLQ